MIYEKLKKYFVNDLLFDDTKIIFVLESPHTQEVKNGYPVAGKSGVDMSKVLFNFDEAFGKLIHENKIKNIGILNVCNYPLQMSAYDSSSLEDDMKFFEKIRQNPKLRKKENPINLVIKKIMNDFKNRLYLHKNHKIVLCGNFAQNAFESIADSADFKEIISVPHPSFNNWKKAIYKEKIEKLKSFLK